MTHQTKNQALELWGGVEPTINRVGDRFHRQLERSGHRERLSDLDEFAQLGLRTLRFPILWEEIAPESAESFNWSSVDAALERLRELRIRPIAGLVHHGSGPRHTSLVDPEFPGKLAHFAAAVAGRYPWIDAYTPVNEPLTTARFSGLYGLWFPHARDQQTFARCLVNQCRAVVLAMRAIRQVNPDAALLQTDDLGKTYTSPRLRYQADYENERRWLTWDLLCGTVDPSHRMWRELVGNGVTETELEWFQKNPCPPDIIGVNHYITSERYLDENLTAHPPETHGGNIGGDRYADVAAVRTRPEGITGAEGMLREAWDRYRRPLAITEAHLACTREEQLRWFMEIWRGAERLRAEGADVRAVTVWSLLGAFDWNSLLTREDGCYESGAFDLRGGALRPTAIAKMIRHLTGSGRFDHPVLDTAGWWRRSVRMLTPAETDPEAGECVSQVTLTDPLLEPNHNRLAGPPLLITGADGKLAQGFVRAAELRGLRYRLCSRAELAITDTDAVGRVIESIEPWAVINCAGFSRIDAAETDEESCFRSNATGAAILARACARADIPLVTFSSDHVFDGRKGEPYIESDEAHALNIYGASKLAAERDVLAAYPETLVIRPGKVFGPLEEKDSLRRDLRVLARGKQVQIANDLRVSGTYLPDLVHVTLDLLIDGERGIWHLANTGSVTPEQLLRRAAELIGLQPGGINGVPSWRLRRPAVRPANRVLATARGQLLPPLQDALLRYSRETPNIHADLGELAAAS